MLWQPQIGFKDKKVFLCDPGNSKGTVIQLTLIIQQIRSSTYENVINIYLTVFFFFFKKKMLTENWPIFTILTFLSKIDGIKTIGKSAISYGKTVKFVDTTVHSVSTINSRSQLSNHNILLTQLY